MSGSSSELARFSKMPGGPSWAYWQGRDGRYDMRGENARSAKLTASDVAEIKAAPLAGSHRAPGGVSNAALARCYGVSTTAIRRIRSGDTWNVVDPGEWPSQRWNAYIKERPGGEMR